MKATYKLTWNRLNKLNDEKKAVVQLRVTYNRKSRYITSGIYLKADEWSEKDGGTVKKHPNAIKLNNELKEMRKVVEDYEFECNYQKKAFNLEDIDKLFSKEEDNSDSFIEFMKRYNDADNSIKFTTYKQIKSFVNYVEKTGLFSLFKDVTYRNVERFEQRMQADSMCSATIAKKHVQLNRFINKAIKRGIAIEDPYTIFKAPRPQPAKRKFLTIEELKRLRDKPMPLQRLEVVRDLFLFSCYTGLADADVRKLQHSDFYEMHGRTYLITDRQKTDEESAIPLIAPAIELYDRYKQSDGPLFKMPTNQKINAYLKEIQLIAEISTTLTYHVARHTFATTVTLENGVPIETVSRMLGHSNLKTTQIYAKMTRKRLSDDMDKVEGIF